MTLPRIPPPGYRYQPDDFVVRATSPESSVPWILPPAESCEGGGWWFAPSVNQVHFCPATCETLEACNASVEVELACGG